MKNRYLLKHLIVISLVATGTRLSAQTTNQVLKITYPESRAIFQRENDNTSTIYLSGSLYQPVDSIQARLQVEATGQGLNTNWVTIQRNPQGGIFQGAIRARGGWYRLEVQAFIGGVATASDVVRKVGIGEVFIITGQSNAQGFQNYGAVGAVDDRVNCVTYDNTAANSLGDPPAPSFQQLTATSLIGPRGKSAWCWGYLGDLLVKQYNVPVLFINTAWEGTSLQNWRESSLGLITKNLFALGTPGENFPKGMPYSNLVIALRYYCSLQGLRAVLWQQGEYDNFPLKSSRKEYADNMQFLVNKTRADTDRYPAWVLARSSYSNGTVSENVIQAQNDVINTYNNNVFAGPFTDNIQVPRFDDVHFGNRATNNPGDKGLNDLGQAWFESLNAVFFSSSRPLPPLPQPTITVACAPSANSVSLSLPNLYKSFTWSTGQTTQNITVTQPGVYQAVLKDNFGNTYLSPALDLQGPIQPATPTISLASQPGKVIDNQQQICADSTLSLLANTTTNSTGVWGTSTTTTIGKAIKLNQSGSYSLQAVNIYGCRSAQPAALNLTVRPKVPTPSIEQIGAYSLQAVLPRPTGGQPDLFDWRRAAGEVIPQTGAVAKVIVSANYSARARTTFTLNNGSALTCFSEFSTPKAFAFDRSNGGLSIYPNPSSTGSITIETIEDLANANVDVFSLSGQKLFSSQVPSFNERKAIDLTGLGQGVYLVRVRSAGFDVSRRIIINR
ncbi:T9SS type A sorting domain-containing protein [Spirosoma fluviale]|uniref:Por secretion system C-terminal sorting domain-containing protein n=1 Tax=Spirosoma fluviale TaxID=1597977 RepID=A0A286FY15_9BACT|nr:T9SS type A sorting domain-containing protein [Spirosoma fluviale]SOD88155.1 Por secretion system C-terminal sorting domain-containing protein [Spirosoma fluviale]